MPTITTTEGSVERVGAALRVALPLDMPVSTRRTLENQLVLHSHAVAAADDPGWDVPVEYAYELDEVLTRPWPAGRWPWRWTDAARSAVTVGVEHRERLLRALDDNTDTGIGDGLAAPSRSAALLDALTAARFTRTLLPAQRDAVAKLVRNEGGGNFSVPGSGKTTMTLAVYAALRHAGLVDRMLVVAPLSAYEAWQEENQACFEPVHRPALELAVKAPRRTTEIVVVNYETTATASARAGIDGWSRGRRLLVVFDEAHRAKRGPHGEHGRGAIDVSQLATRRMVLTGTPMPNGPDDLANTLELAWPGHGQTLASTLHPRGHRTWVRITKDQLGLEPAHVVVHDIPLDENHHKIYAALARGLADDEDAFIAHPHLAVQAVTRLIATASNPALLTPDAGGLNWWSELPTTSRTVRELLDHLVETVRPAKLLAAAAMAKAHHERDEKLLVWTNFLGNVTELERLTAPYNPAVITGSLPRDDRDAPTDRARQLAKFRQDPTCTVLIATPQTLGEGVSLHKACQSQVHVDRTFNAGLYLQALDRTHRVGMPEGTTARVAVLVARDTIDGTVQTSLDRKLREMDSRLRDPSLRRLAAPDRKAFGITPAQAASLLAHLRRTST